MKKHLVLSVLVIAIGFSAGAQQIDTSKVPAAVKAAFAKKYPGQQAKWEKENGQFEAVFKQEGKNSSALFTKEGTMKESETEIKVAELPMPVLAYVKAHYKGAVVKEAAKITKADGTVNYEAGVNRKDVIFDEKGNFVKEVKE